VSLDPPPHEPQSAISEAIDAYLSKCQSRDIEPSTLAKYKTLTNQLTAYSTGKGYVYLDQLGVTDTNNFCALWKDGKKG
jgi:hypothetical protein